MSYLSFNKKELINLEYSLKREVLATNRAGGYASTTISGCNTRKYHGLLVVPIKKFDNQNHILLSSLDETVIQHDKEFNLGIHKYPNTYAPRGHKYIVDLSYEPSLAITYRVGGVRLKKEFLLAHNESQIMIRYTLLEATSKTYLRLKPFLAFRSIHELSTANLIANTRYKNCENGIKSKLYANFPYLHMQLSKKNEFIAVPDWYKNIQYLEEKKRGYEYQEDIFVPGYFEFPIKKGESIIFSAATDEVKTRGLKRKFTEVLSRRTAKNNFKNSLTYSASQFITKQEKATKLTAAYPWSNSSLRDTLISLPGILSNHKEKIEKATSILNSVVKQLHKGVFFDKKRPLLEADTPLWFFWTLQQYEKLIHKKANIWQTYKKFLISILNSYKKGSNEGINMSENGLIWAKHTDKALTWMNANNEGMPVTQRGGYTVEINALWYNAICYALELAEKEKDTKFLNEWKNIPEQIKESFQQHFWYTAGNYLADYIDEKEQNIMVRPNQLLACSLPYSPITDHQKKKVLDVIKKELLTPKGLRSLSPKYTEYKGCYAGNETQRNKALHQGSIYPWLIAHYIETNFKLYDTHFISDAEKIIKNYEDDIHTYGLYCIAEIYDGDPPHLPKGSISQATSIGELLRSIALIKEMKKIKK